MGLGLLIRGVQYCIERVTECLGTISSDHASIHAKLAYTLENRITISSAKIAGISLEIPEGVYVHFKPTGFSSTAGPVYIDVYEDKTFVGGVTTSAVNRHRIPPVPSSQVTIKTLADCTPVDGVAPVLLASMTIGGSSNGVAKIGGATSQDEERVFSNTSILIQIQNVTSPGTDAVVGYMLSWYEEGSA